MICAIAMITGIVRNIYFLKKYKVKEIKNEKKFSILNDVYFSAGFWRR